MTIIPHTISFKYKAPIFFIYEQKQMSLSGNHLPLPLLFRKSYFRQNTAIWVQPMHIHNLTQAQDLSQLHTIDPIAIITDTS